jgi:hypothetical protein
MADLSRPERLQVMLDAEELAAVDDWRFRMRMPSRAAAIRELLKRGLAAEPTAAARQGEKSSSFGVVGESSFEGAEERRSPPVPTQNKGNGNSTRE